MKNIHLILPVCFAICFSFSGIQAQSIKDNPHLNRAFLRYFSVPELTEIQTQEPERYEHLQYFFTESFNVKKTNCSTCEIDYELFFNLHLFNIVQFDNQRAAKEELTFSFFNNTYQITLFSRETVEAEIGNYSLDKLLSRIPHRDLPKWKDSGNPEEDYKQYKEELGAWAKDFPIQFKQKLSSSEPLKIHINELTQLPSDKKNQILSRSQGYIIID